MSAVKARDNEKRRYAMLNDPIRKVVPAMALPTIVSSIVMSLYNLADTFFVSSLGTAATAAVGVNQTLMNVIQMFGMAIAVGANSYIARLLGAKEDEKADSVLSTVFFAGIGIGLLLLVFGMIFMKPLVYLMGARDDVVPYSMSYASYILYAAPFMMAVFVMNHCLRAEGSPIFSMLGMLSGSVLNVALDPLFIFTFDMGVGGAAAATAVSKLFSFCVLITPYIRKHTMLHISFKKVKFTKDTVLEVSKIGMPTLLRSGLLTFSNAVTNNVAAAFSTSSLAAMSVANRVMHLFSSAIMGFGQGFQVVAGFNWGAKRYDRVRKSLHFANFFGITVVAVISAVGIVFAKPIIGVFSKTDDMMLSISMLSLITQCIVSPLHAWSLNINSMYTALGKAGGAALLSLARQGLFLIPSVVILSLVFKEQGLACAQAASDVLSMSIAIPFTVRICKELRGKEAAEAETVGLVAMRETL